MKARIYTDTSVIGGCLDEEFKEGSLRLIQEFMTNNATMVLSDLTFLELQLAPEQVRQILGTIPDASKEYVELTKEAAILAEWYITERVIGRAKQIDAQHIAVATVNRVDALVSWNFQHVVNLHRIRGYNSVNLRLGYPTIEIRTPAEVIRYGEEQEI